MTYAHPMASLVDAHALKPPGVTTGSSYPFGVDISARARGGRDDVAAAAAAARPKRDARRPGADASEPRGEEIVSTVVVRATRGGVARPRGGRDATGVDATRASAPIRSDDDAMLATGVRVRAGGDRAVRTETEGVAVLVNILLQHFSVAAGAASPRAAPV
jgi:hypothetical protein